MGGIVTKEIEQGRVFMKKILFVVLTFSFFPLFSADRQVYRDGSGRVVGTVTVEKNRTVYRDGSGRVTGSATVNGNRTIYRDGSGRTTGSVTEERGGRSVFRDADGRRSGTLK